MPRSAERGAEHTPDPASADNADRKARAVKARAGSERLGMPPRIVRGSYHSFQSMQEVPDDLVKGYVIRAGPASAVRWRRTVVG